MRSTLFQEIFWTCHTSALFVFPFAHSSWDGATNAVPISNPYDLPTWSSISSFAMILVLVTGSASIAGRPSYIFPFIALSTVSTRNSLNSDSRSIWAFLSVLRRPINSSYDHSNFWTSWRVFPTIGSHSNFNPYPPHAFTSTSTSLMRIYWNCHAPSSNCIIAFGSLSACIFLIEFPPISRRIWSTTSSKFQSPSSCQPDSLLSAAFLFRIFWPTSFGRLSSGVSIAIVRNISCQSFLRFCSFPRITQIFVSSKSFAEMTTVSFSARDPIKSFLSLGLSSV